MGGRRMQVLGNWGIKLCFLAAWGILFFRVSPLKAQGYYEPKSEDAAAALSFFGTAVPVGAGIWLGSELENTGGLTLGLVTGGLMIGPSLGYFYADLYKRGLIGIGIRTFIIGGTLVAEEIRENKKKNCGWEGCRVEGPSTIVLIGTGALFVATLADMFWVTEAVKMRNQKLYHGGFTVLPKYFPQHKTSGLQLQISF